MNNTYVLILVLLLAFLSPAVYAGKIKNLNVNASNGAQVNIQNEKGSEVNNIKVKKEHGSSVKLNGKEVDCGEEEAKKGICSPEMF